MGRRGSKALGLGIRKGAVGWRQEAWRVIGESERRDDSIEERKEGAGGGVVSRFIRHLDAKMPRTGVLCPNSTILASLFGRVYESASRRQHSLKCLFPLGMNGEVDGLWADECLRIE